MWRGRRHNKSTGPLSGSGSVEANTPLLSGQDDSNFSEGNEENVQVATFATSSTSTNHAATATHAPALALTHAHDPAPAPAPASSTVSRRKLRKMKRQQYHLAANEIERILFDDVVDGGFNVDQNLEGMHDDYDDHDDDDNDNNLMGEEDTIHLLRGATRGAQRSKSASAATLARHSFPSTFTKFDSPIPGAKRRLLPAFPTLMRSRPFASLSNHDADTTAGHHQHNSNTHSTRKRRSSAMGLHNPFFFREQDINAYGLFDSAGPDEAHLLRRARHHHRNSRVSTAAPAATTITRMSGGSSSSILHTTTTTAAAAASNSREHSNLFANNNSAIVTSSTTTTHSNTTTPDTTTTITLHDNTPSNQNSFLIYDSNKYGSSTIPVFTLILFFLCITFCVLLIIQIVVGLLTVAVGWILLSFVTLHILRELYQRPLKWIQYLHKRPILAWTILGALIGLGTKVWTMETRTSIYSTMATVFNSIRRRWLPHVTMGRCNTKDEGRTIDSFVSTVSYCWHTTSSSWHQDILKDADTDNLLTTATATSTATSSSYSGFASMTSLSQDLVLLWGFTEGLIYGMQIGAVWLVLLGDARDPSKLTLWFQHCVWRHIKVQYRQFASQFMMHNPHDHHRSHYHSTRRQSHFHYRTPQWWNQLTRHFLSNGNGDSSENDNNNSSSHGDSDRKHCMICLEGFVEEAQKRNAGVNGEDDYDDVDGGNVSSLFRRRFLVCGHSFHSHCVREWIQINASCPICRIPIDKTIVPQGK